MDTTTMWVLGGWAVFVTACMLVIRRVMSGRWMGGDLPKEEREDPPKK